MDPVANPYSPGAGTPPPELVGREVLRPEAGLADNGDLEQDLPALLETVGLAAQRADTEVGPLPDPAAALAITKPAHNEGVEIDEDAVTQIVGETKGYPFREEVLARHGRVGSGPPPLG